MSKLPPTFVATRQALHAVAEHLLGATSYATIGKIGLRANESGFSTQDLNGITYTISGPYLTDGARSVLLPGSTMRGVAEWMGVIPGAPATLYTPTTELDLETPLDIDTNCAVMIGEWFAGMQEVLTGVFPDEVLQLWPEHFDLATAVNEVNYGASPGDDAIPEPYIYIGPWGQDFTPMPYSELIKASDPLAAAAGFFQRGKRLFG